MFAGGRRMESGEYSLFYCGLISGQTFSAGVPLPFSLRAFLLLPRSLCIVRVGAQLNTTEHSDDEELAQYIIK